MEEDFTADLSQYQLPTVDVPITHDVPKTTLESLVQIKKEFEDRIETAKENNDNTKKRRFERQLKGFDAAIKATKLGKDYNYTELQGQVPPGFSKIPLRDGRPISSSNLAPASSIGPTRLSPQRVSPQPPKRVPPPPPVDYDEEASDDLLNMLENELDMNDDDFGDDDGGYIDPEEERFNKQIKAAQKLIPDIKVPKEEMLEEDIMQPNRKIPKGNPQKLPQISQVPQLPKMPQVQELPQFPQGPQIPQVPTQPKPSIQSQQKSQKHSKDLQTILERQRLFKEAALKAKQDGNTSVALVYLRHSKGFDTMIMAAESGLPVDMTNLPIPPQLEAALKKQSINTKAATLSPTVGLNKAFGNVKIQSDDFEFLDIPKDSDRDTIYKLLLKKLREQIEISSDNFKHFSKMGDINNANKFKKIAQESIQDLEALKNADKLNEPVPLYHYEQRAYETIDCNSDLTDNDLEIEIIRAINLTVPKDHKVDHMNTFVKFEFPFPPEDLQSDKTKVQHGNCNPEYNQSFKLQISRKQSKFMRLMNRKELKLEIYLKGGFLRSDKLLANCGVKLQPLENSSTIHNAFELLEGRRQTGGKLELKIRIREPLLHKGIQKVEHKWLIIDKFKLQQSATRI